MPIRTVGLTPGHRWCGGHRSVKPAVNNGKGAPGLVHGPNSLNATYIRPGHISDRPRKLAKDLRNGHLEPDQATLDVAAARAILNLDFQQTDKDRMRELLAKAKEGTLTANEKVEIDNYERVGHMLSLMKSKARRSLKGGKVL